MWIITLSPLFDFLSLSFLLLYHNNIKNASVLLIISSYFPSYSPRTNRRHHTWVSPIFWYGRRVTPILRKRSPLGERRRFATARANHWTQSILRPHHEKTHPNGVRLRVKGLRKGYKNISGWIKQKRMIFLKTVSILTIGRFYSLQTINSVIYLNFLCCLIREISPTSQQWTFALRKMLHYLLKHMPDLV